MDVLSLSRIQFGDTAAFHILWPVMSIGLALYVFVMEALWLKTGREHFYRQARFWLKLFVLTFAVGVASGFPLAFQFGTNWSAFATAAGSFFGNALGFETTIAFTLETASLGILIFGWNKVPRWVHLSASFLVFAGASLSAFWIMVANSWMQIPLGTHLQNGVIVVDDHLLAIINRETLVSYSHMMLAAIESTLFMIGGISAWQVLRNRSTEVTDFFRRSFRYALVLALVAAPLQVVVGDLSGLTVAQYQPEKLAASELHWNTNAPGTGASWSIIALPNASGTGNAVDVSIPDALSLIVTHSTTGTVQGLNAFPADDRPTASEATVTYYAFRLMVAIGFFLVFIAALGAWFWYRGELSLEKIRNHPWLLRAWIFAIPLGLIATESGWMVREIGRQPWIIFHALRVSDGLSSNLSAPVVGTVLIAIVAIYLTLISFFILYSWRTIEKGPDLESPLPIPPSRS